MVAACRRCWRTSAARWCCAVRHIDTSHTDRHTHRWLTKTGELLLQHSHLCHRVWHDFGLDITQQCEMTW